MMFSPAFMCFSGQRTVDRRPRPAHLRQKYTGAAIYLALPKGIVGCSATCHDTPGCVCWCTNDGH